MTSLSPHRRAVLAGGLALATTAGFARRGLASAAPVLVIGAGIAGLAAAQALHRAGQAVIVIEARARIGGRLDTSHLWPDLPIDLGASWIHGITGNPLTELARAAGAPLVPQEGTLAIRDTAGRWRPELEARFEVAADRINRAREAWSENDAPLSQVVAAYSRIARADDALQAALDHVVHAEIEQEYAADWQDLSAWWFDAAADGRGPDALLPGGYDRLAAVLAQGLDIRLNAPVTGLRQVAQGVAVQLRDGSVVTGRGAVVTLPLGVLQAGDVVFDPPLSTARQEAINRLGMGLLNKLVLRFDTPFWHTDADWLGLFGANRLSWANLEPATGTPVLMGLQAGRAAEADEARSTAELMAEAMVDLRAAFGSAVPDPVGVQVSRWRRDPFARGSYSYHPPGSTPEDRVALAGMDWQGHLAFAGEATARDHPATVHGALLSGEAAARAVL